MVRDKKKIEKIMDSVYYGFFHSIPKVILVILSEEVHTKEKAAAHAEAMGIFPKHRYLNSGAALTSMCFEATSLGIGNCILSLKVNETNRLLNVPKDKEAILGIGLGYEKKGAYQKEKERKSLEELVFYEQYGRKRQ